MFWQATILILDNLEVNLCNDTILGDEYYPWTHHGKRFRSTIYLLIANMKVLVNFMETTSTIWKTYNYLSH